MMIELMATESVVSKWLKERKTAASKDGGLYPIPDRILDGLRLLRDHAPTHYIKYERFLCPEEKKYLTRSLDQTVTKACSKRPVGGPP